MGRKTRPDWGCVSTSEMGNTRLARSGLARIHASIKPRDEMPDTENEWLIIDALVLWLVETDGVKFVALVLWEWEIDASLAEGSLGYFVGRDFGAHMVVPSW